MINKKYALKTNCYAKAFPHEPVFTLLGRDPVASGLVALWAALRSRNYIDAHRLLAELIQEMKSYCEIGTLNPAAVLVDDPPEKIRSALRVSLAMEAYRNEDSYCHVCGCTDTYACPDGCHWANDEQTICSNPACMKAAGL